MTTRAPLMAALTLAAGAAGSTPVHAAEPLHLFAAGSLTGAMMELLAQSGIPADQIATPVFGPSGVLRERIEKGAAADILTSADMRQPRQLAREHENRPVVMFARNQLCALVKESAGVTAATLLDYMLDPNVRVATSTPGADPGGDYAWAVFARADAIRPGAKAALEAKALKLVGGPDSKPLIAGHGQVQGVFLADKADMMLGYCSGSADVVREIPGLASVPLSPQISVAAAYGLVTLTSNPLANRFALFILSEQGQAILSRHGFLPVSKPSE